MFNDTSAPITQWRKISDNMKIPFDQDKKIHLEYDGYKGDPIKQADVVLLAYPLMYPMSQDIRYNDLMYYEKLTDINGPAMTYSMHVIGFLELGMIDEASRLFPTSYSNYKAPFFVWTEIPNGGATNFITGCGGFLQGVLFGYGGMRIYPERIDFTSNLPPNTTSMKLKGINYLGSTLSVSYLNSTNTSVVLHKQGKYPLILNYKNFHIPLKEGVPEGFSTSLAKTFSISVAKNKQ